MALNTSDNVPIDEIPSAIVDGQGLKQIETGFLDVTKPPYGAAADGATDVSDILQQAINDAYNYNLVVWFPKGTYLLSAQQHSLRNSYLYLQALTAQTI